MENFTPLKPIEKKKRKVNKFLIFGNLFLVILVAAIGIFYYNETLLTTQQKAYEHKSCSEYESPSECDNNCSPYKSNGQSFFCNWSYPQDECKESSNICEAGGGGGGGEPTLTPTPTQPIMSVCNETCSSSDPCFNEEPGPNELVCTDVDGGVSRCRNKDCVTSPTCVCPTSTPTPTPTGTIMPTVTPTSTPTPTATPTGTVTPSNTPTATPTNTPGPSATPIPVLCGTKDCDNVTNPCRSGYDCVQADDGSNYCTSPDFTDACKANPSYNSCCTAPGAPTATPTEIILAQTTVTSPPVPVTGMVQSFMYLIPALIILVGLIL